VTLSSAGAGRFSADVVPVADSGGIADIDTSELLTAAAASDDDNDDCGLITVAAAVAAAADLSF